MRGDEFPDSRVVEVGGTELSSFGVEMKRPKIGQRGAEL